MTNINFKPILLVHPILTKGPRPMSNNHMAAKMTWKENMHFECHNRNHNIQIDASINHGGDNKGPSPKELLLDAMIGCTGMDVVSILMKMRQDIKAFDIEIDVEKTTEHPTHFKTALIKFFLTGTIDKDKAIKAVHLSLSQYCGVNFIVSKTCRISYEIYLNANLVHADVTHFN